MTEKEMKHKVEKQKLMLEEYKNLLEKTQSKEFENYDGLTKDLIIAEINAIRTYLAIVGICIGLNINHLEKETPKEEGSISLNTDSHEESNDGQKEDNKGETVKE